VLHAICKASLRLDTLVLMPVGCVGSRRRVGWCWRCATGARAAPTTSPSKVELTVLPYLERPYSIVLAASTRRR
jgi:hypothetical protein